MRLYDKALKLLSSQPRTAALLRKASGLILNYAWLNRGIPKEINGLGQKIRFDGYFAFSDFTAFGTAHNSGYHKLLQLSENKQVVFDVGAHIGLSAIPLSYRINPSGMVYAFEPSSSNFEYLRKNIAYNGRMNIKLFNYVVGAASAVKVRFHESSVVSAMNALIPYRINASYRCVWKEQISLDDFCSQHKVIPDLIKIDVEGAEFNVLKGAGGIMRKARPAIVLSVHPRHLKMMGIEVADLMGLIENYDYKVLDINGNPAHELQFGEYLVFPSEVPEL